jgi:hypothetical protein
VLRELALGDMELGSLPRAQQWVDTLLRLGEDGALNAIEHRRGLDLCAQIDVARGHWSDALNRFAEVAQRVQSQPDQWALKMNMHRALFMDLLGRRDLARQILRSLAPQDFSTPALRLVLQACLTAVGESVDLDRLLEQVTTLDDLRLRANILLILRTGAGQSAAMLPVLSLSAETMQRGGAQGYALALHGRLSRRLADAGRCEEANRVARSAWTRSESGITPCGLSFAEFAADLADALLICDAPLAAVVAKRGCDWVRAAVEPLPGSWRQACLQRSPALLRLTRCLDIAHPASPRRPGPAGFAP